MELVTSDPKGITIRFDRQQEYGILFAVLRTFRTELEGDNIDMELLMRSKEKTEEFLEEFFKLDDGVA